MIDFDALDARVEARLAALAHRSGGGISFSAGDEPEEIAVLARLLDLARGAGHDEDAALNFAADAAAATEGPLARARRECAAFLHQVWREVTSLALVRTGELAVTRVTWTGSATLVFVPDASAQDLGRHHDSVVVALRAASDRLRLVTMIAATASKIAAMIAIPGAAVTALPVAYRCVRDIYDEWRAQGSERRRGGERWQPTT